MRKTDYLLLVVICLVALAGYLFFHSTDNKTAKLLIIQHDNKVIERVDLEKVTAETRLDVPVQDGTLTLMYDKKGAWVESSPCPKALYPSGKNYQSRTNYCLSAGKGSFDFNYSRKGGRVRCHHPLNILFRP